MCDRIENSDLTGPDRIGVILAGTGPDYKPEKLTGLAGSTEFLPEFKNLNTQLTSHKHKYGSFVL